MNAFRVKGEFMMKDRWRPFTKEVIGENEEDARERILSIIGSQHKVKRKLIKIENLTQIQQDDIENPVIKFMIEEQNAK